MARKARDRISGSEQDQADDRLEKGTVDERCALATQACDPGLDQTVRGQRVQPRSAGLFGVQ